MLPLRDENPVVRRPITVMVIIGINVVVWAFIQGFGNPLQLAQSFCLYALIPGELLGTVSQYSHVQIGNELQCPLNNNAGILTPLTSMFLHGGWFHILGNMWFLWVFGDNVEDAMGWQRFILFYLLCGLAAAAAQMVSNPDSMAPMVGASGAIGGVMGGYARLYPKARVHTLIFLGIFITTVSLPAYVMLGYWFVLQLLGGIPAVDGGEGGVAFWAHVGGFVAGVLLVNLMSRPDYLADHRAQPAVRTAKHSLF